MGIYLGQLPPAEIARLKAELAETLIANFCYPRFFDARTQTLRMRPVGRAKRQEVWLYLSSVDFTQWSRLDLMAPEFQHHIERLFIQFVQRNRSFFGEQGRKRMSDIRMLLGSSATSVVQGLRNHITGQKRGNPPFGTPRPVISWGALNVNGRPDLSWEQIAASTMALQQQLQELRGEIRPLTQDGRALPPPARRATRSQPLGPATSGTEQNGAARARTQASAPMSPSGISRTTNPLAPDSRNAPAPEMVPAASVAPARKSEPLVAAPEVASVPHRSGAPGDSNGRTSSAPRGIAATVVPETAPAPPPVALAPVMPVQVREMPQVAQEQGAAASVAAVQRDAAMMHVGEDDIAIFEQMRHQLLLWLRVEAVTSGLEIAGQSPSQLLELLRQSGRLDETRLQVVSTLLNLSNQVIKTGLVTILDYKQALMFHLMHTKR